MPTPQVTCCSYLDLSAACEPVNKHYKRSLDCGSPEKEGSDGEQVRAQEGVVGKTLSVPQQRHWSGAVQGALKVSAYALAQRRVPNARELRGKRCLRLPRITPRPLNGFVSYLKLNGQTQWVSRPHARVKMQGRQC